MSVTPRRRRAFLQGQRERLAESKAQQDVEAGSKSHRWLRTGGTEQGPLRSRRKGELYSSLRASLGTQESRPRTHAGTRGARFGSDSEPASKLGYMAQRTSTRSDHTLGTFGGRMSPTRSAVASGTDLPGAGSLLARLGPAAQAASYRPAWRAASDSEQRMSSLHGGSPIAAGGRGRQLQGGFGTGGGGGRSLGFMGGGGSGLDAAAARIGDTLGMSPMRRSGRAAPLVPQPVDLHRIRRGDRGPAAPLHSGATSDDDEEGVTSAHEDGRAGLLQLSSDAMGGPSPALDRMGRRDQRGQPGRSTGGFSSTGGSIRMLQPPGAEAASAARSGALFGDSWVGSDGVARDISVESAGRGSWGPDRPGSMARSRDAAGASASVNSGGAASSHSSHRRGQVSATQRVLAGHEASAAYLRNQRGKKEAGSPFAHRQSSRGSAGRGKGGTGDAWRDQ